MLDAPGDRPHQSHMEVAPGGGRQITIRHRGILTQSLGPKKIVCYGLPRSPLEGDKSLSVRTSISLRVHTVIKALQIDSELFFYFRVIF